MTAGIDVFLMSGNLLPSPTSSHVCFHRLWSLKHSATKGGTEDLLPRAGYVFECRHDVAAADSVKRSSSEATTTGI